MASQELLAVSVLEVTYDESSTSNLKIMLLIRVEDNGVDYFAIEARGVVELKYVGGCLHFEFNYITRI